MNPEMEPFLFVLFVTVAWALFFNALPLWQRHTTTTKKTKREDQSWMVQTRKDGFLLLTLKEFVAAKSSMKGIVNPSRWGEVAFAMIAKDN